MIKWRPCANSDDSVEGFQDVKNILNPIQEILFNTKNIKRYLLKSSQAIS